MAQKSKYVKWGLTAFCTVCAILLVYDTLFGSRTLIKFTKKFLRAAMPVIYGGFMAYLLAPVVDFFEKPFAGTLAKSKGGSAFPVLVRAGSILLTWAVIAVLLYLLGSVLLPELYKSVTQLISNVEDYYLTVSGWIENLLEANPQVETWAVAQLDKYYDTAQKWVQTDLLPRTTALMAVVSGGVFGVVGFFGDLLVGIIVSVYFLGTKELCAAHARKVIHGLFTEDHVYWILRGSRKVDSIFSGFVRGKLLDSLIIGILCFIGCSILNFPYAPLISVIVGVTNVIPFFGPFLGAIPSAFLILLVSPLKAFYFAIFVLGLQQLDGNVIGPTILGDKTGLPSLWVILAILVGGSFFGVAGMFFGVPVCACFYSAVTFYVERRLEKKALPVETKHYAAGSVEEPVEPEKPEDAPEEKN